MVHCVCILPYQVLFYVVYVRILASLFGYTKHAEIGDGNDRFQHVRIFLLVCAIYVLVHSGYMRECDGPLPRPSMACTLHATNGT